MRSKRAVIEVNYGLYNCVEIYIYIYNIQILNNEHMRTKLAVKEVIPKQTRKKYEVTNPDTKNSVNLEQKNIWGI